ncbi:MTH1187 family thiamine-binding protein [Pseudodesulfovibrio thermohalotolerans]|uniref:MTH1187 family thiamine-binding protein n=1 Tax=Pseudodesulfovibrio thermohalotolerans TaxID=2880651 RepID=UPI0024422F33|nr:MTH1187 family thiamine-binding protein [Pseudodesulfovibrio thermohalotolerans]WFS61070.1 MTH1187 family thiamine-binding protein [Pseudodesulfovibrio thermohalotolerans]
MSCVATFSIFPLERTDEGSLAPYVARTIAIVRESGLPYELGAMGTVIEGDFDKVMATIKRCHDDMRNDCGRVYLTLAVDSRSGEAGRMQSKVDSVGELLK